MTEMMPYWGHAFAAVAAEPGRPVGRELDDPDRVGAVASANGVPRAEALTRLRHAAHEAATAISRIDEQGWQASGIHPVRGPISVGEGVRTLIIEHAEGHVRQALAAAGAASATPGG
jgi:hypothetical protein